MTNSLEELIRDRLVRWEGKDAQQKIWDILIACYPDLKIQTPKMQHDLGNDGYSMVNKIFFAMYIPESGKYNNANTVNKIGEDYQKFTTKWLKEKSFFPQFTDWIFVTKDNLMGKPHQKMVELNGNGDGVRKQHWGLEQLVKLVLDLKPNDQARIFNLPPGFCITTASEIETIMDLITYISDRAALKPEDFEEVIPDPQKKFDRFSEYCNQLKNEIVNAGISYKIAITEAENIIGMDKIKTATKVAYLKQQSCNFLNENENNPIKALNKFTSYLEQMLQKNARNHTYTAIRHYLILEIPKCNVFPND